MTLFTFLMHFPGLIVNYLLEKCLSL